MRRRITQVLGLRVYSDSAVVDPRYGNAVPGWAEPVDLPVYGVAPNQSSEPDEPGRSRVLSGRTVYAPLSSPVKPHDRVVIAGETWEVVGEVGPWSLNPHGGGYHEGVQFNLERSEG